MEDILQSWFIIGIYGWVSLFIILLSNLFYKEMIKRDELLNTIRFTEKISFWILLVAYLIKSPWMLWIHMLYLLLLTLTLVFNVIHKTVETAKMSVLIGDIEVVKKSFIEGMIDKYFWRVPTTFKEEYEKELLTLRKNMNYINLLLILYFVSFLFIIWVPYLVTWIQNNTIDISWIVNSAKWLFDFSDLFG